MAITEITLQLDVPIGVFAVMEPYQWCIDNDIFVVYTVNWTGGVTFKFDKEADATVFALKWAK
jgi:hypothetical protein